MRKAFVIALAVLALAPLASAQSYGLAGWSVSAPSTTYFITETANVTVYGPNSTYFDVQVNRATNNMTNFTTIYRSGGNTGTFGNCTIYVAFPSSYYINGTYRIQVSVDGLNVTYKDIVLLFSQAYIDAEREALQARTDAELIAYASADEERDRDQQRQIDENFTLSYWAIVLAIVCTELCIILVLLPRLLFELAQSSRWGDWTRRHFKGWLPAYIPSRHGIGGDMTNGKVWDEYDTVLEWLQNVGEGIHASELRDAARKIGMPSYSQDYPLRSRLMAGRRAAQLKTLSDSNASLEARVKALEARLAKVKA